ncbi:MAG: hypothetical protein RMK94_06115 [Armatimonadota bacterium]|nr:hypothetical protein [Armatimonadota bacterium]
MVRRESFLQALWLIAVAVNFGLLLFLVHSLWAFGFFSKPKIMTAKDDPKLGSEIPEPLKPFLDTEKPLIVVVFGQCSECTLRNLNGWVVMLDRWSEEVKGVIVATEREKVLRKWANELGWQIPYLADGKGKVLKELNAYFLPKSLRFQFRR